MRSQTRRRLHDRVVGRALGVGSGQAVSGDADVDEVVVDFTQSLDIDSDARVDTRAKVVHEYVRSRHEPVQQRQSLRMLEVECDGSLASVETGKHAGDAIVHGP